MKYWMNDLKKTERAIYLGHITADSRFYGEDEEIGAKLSQLWDETEGTRISMLRDLCDEHPTSMGSYYGLDVFLIVKNGYLKKNQGIIEKMKDVLS